MIQTQKMIRSPRITCLSAPQPQWYKTYWSLLHGGINMTTIFCPGKLSISFCILPYINKPLGGCIVTCIWRYLSHTCAKLFLVQATLCSIPFRPFNNKSQPEHTAIIQRNVPLATRTSFLAHFNRQDLVSGASCYTHCGNAQKDVKEYML